MKGARDYTDYVADMLENAQKAREFVVRMEYEEFVADEKTQYAVVRDKLIHDYIGVNLAVVWRTVEEDLSPLIEQLKEMLKELGA